MRTCHFNFICYLLAESSQKPSEEQSDRDQYRKAPEGSGDKKGDAGAGNFEFVSFNHLSI